MTALDQREYGTRTPSESTSETTTQAIDAERVDENSAGDEVGDLVRARRRAHQAGPTTASIASWKAARSPPRSSAARPRAVVPPGEVTSRRSASVSCRCRRAARRCRPSFRVTSSPALPRGHAAADRRVDPGLGDQRHVGGPDAGDRTGRVDRASPAASHDGADAAEQPADRVVELRIDLRPARRSTVTPGAGPTGRVGLRRGTTGTLGVGRAQLRDGGAASTETTGAWRAGELRGDRRELRRLVREHDDVGALRPARRWTPTASPPSSSASAAARPEPESVHRHGLAPAAGERARHVPGTDEPDSASARRLLRPRRRP